MKIFIRITYLIIRIINIPFPSSAHRDVSFLLTTKMMTYLPIKVSSTYKPYRTSSRIIPSPIKRRTIEVHDEWAWRELERGPHTHHIQHIYMHTTIAPRDLSIVYAWISPASSPLHSKFLTVISYLSQFSINFDKAHAWLIRAGERVQPSLMIHSM